MRSEFRLQALAALEHRVAALAGVVTQFFFGALRVAVFDACFAAAPLVVVPMTATAVRDYLWLSQALIQLVFLRLDPELAGAVRSGSIAVELLRPGDPWPRWFARLTARRLVAMVLRAVPLVGVALLVGWLQPPPSWLAAGLGLVSTLLAVALASALILVVTVAVFWTVVGDGLELVLFAATWAFSGVTLPLPFFPDWLQPLIWWLPFRGLMDTPARLWSTDLPLDQGMAFILHQVLWIVVLTVIGRTILRRGLSRLTILGG